MGEHKLLRCVDCTEYANIGKIRHDYGDGAGPAGDHELVIRFLNEHKGCHVELVGEYGGTQPLWSETSKENGWSEYE